MPHTAVPKRQRSRAKTLRKEMPRAETLLWRHLKAHRLEGLSFRRQEPMGAYIVDFVCHAARLVIEVDGESHAFESQIESDRIRDAWLSSRGYEVVRFTNTDVLGSLEGVALVIGEKARARISNSPPSLALPRKGGGNTASSAARVLSSIDSPLSASSDPLSIPSPLAGEG